MSSDAGNADMPKRSQKVLLLSEKVKVLDLDGKGENCMLRLQKIFSENKSSSHEIVKKEKEMCASFALPSKLQKLQTAWTMRASLRQQRHFHVYNKIF